MSDPARLLTPAQLVELLPWLTARSLRWQLLNADRNGLAECIIRPTPRRLLIDLDGYTRWLDGRRQSNLNGSAA
jgi:hypothetical protein